MNLTRLVPRHRPRADLHPTAAGAPDAPLRLRWLGTAGHVVETPGATVLLDPFLSRPSLGHTATRRLRPTPDDWWAWLPPRVDAIACGHSHYDHLLDAPLIARRTGAKLLGSRTTCSFARAHGVPEAQLVEIPPTGGAARVGDVTIRFVPSLHGRIAAGRVPFPGAVEAPPELPARVWHYKMGGAFGVLLETPGGRVYHNGSADLVDAELEAHDADVLLVGLAGRQATPDYLARMTRLLGPRLLVPTHHDLFFAPLEDGLRLLPGVDLGGFVAEAARLAPDARVVSPGYDDVLAIPAGDPRDARFHTWAGA
ncbi:MAG TPA: MBL fold metallo-hydrolase [Polyangiaceae bacterium LLY-WYZ-15_(1-7)]|nr:MBL fold metallo-hydrolase [Polyangiaceae bacterium LLY-WYZ-15_(1-7)]HJL06920.1 MBL fold metallo-hydrolase [Polyangiaceae bacterium LLY-WYZ-15_(1-7)]HJL37445.1 MBL fold metallo-hydrolase [Polyangiaceae bacterium LLY-WYZ-15_(1-7)]